MYDLQDITRRLLAAGHATSVGGSGIDLLDVDPNTRHLTYKRWNGNGFSDQELIATYVRQNSLAAYLATPTSKLAICISSSSTLRAIGYDKDHDEWIDDDNAANHTAHANSKLAAAFGTDGGQHVFFQEPGKRLVHLDGSWVPTVLPGNPVEGTPLSALVVGGKVQLFYVSASDNCLHYVSQQQNGRWFDVIFATYAFDVKQPKQLFVTQNDSGVIEGYVLTDDNALLKITADATLTSLGTVDSSGTFVPSPPVNPGGTTGPGSIPNKPYNPPPPPATTGDQHFNLPWGVGKISDPSGNTTYQQAASGRTTIQGWPWGNIVISP